ncbi:MAG: hypothetical protein QXW94_02930 [Desulfurococcaceae archaeon]
MAVDRNAVYGSALALFGLVLALGSYLLLGSVPLTALGIGMVVVGAAWALTPVQPVPERSVAELVESSCSNVEAFLELLGASGRAVYVPSRVGVVAYVPLNGSSAPLSYVAENPDKPVARVGGSLGVVVVPPRPRLVSHNPGPPEGDLESALRQVMVEESGVAESVRAVVSGDAVVVEVRRPRIEVGHPRFRLVMGSLASCIAAQAVAAATSRPVTIVDESREGDRLVTRLRLLDWTGAAST